MPVTGHGPQKVLLAYNQHRGRGGSEQAALDLIGLLQQNDIQVEVFTRDSSDVASSLLGRIEAGASIFYAPRSVAAFSKLLDSFAPDVVHVQEIFPLVSPWILPLCTERSIPVVMTCIDYRMTCSKTTHLNKNAVCTRCVGGRDYWAVLTNCRDNLTESFAGALYNTVVRRFHLFTRHVTHFIAPSEFSREWLIKHAKIDARRITTVSPMVQVPETAADAAEGDYVAFTGRFSPEKGLATFLEASKLGDIPFRLCRNANSLVTVDVPADVQVVLTHTREELNNFYRGARMLVLPSVWFESFGLVGAEAMSHGIPVVASRLGAMTSLVEDGVDGYCFRAGDAKDLSRIVKRLWDDHELCRRLGAAGRQKVISQWSPEIHFANLMAIYRSCQTARGNSQG
jgi:glycosyltransferase involved in cell wall biosynthesis